MSQWTHIRGGMELVSRPYEKRKPKKPLVEPKKEDFETEADFDQAYRRYALAERKLLYYPYPEEQFKLDMPLSKSYGHWDKKLQEYVEEGHTLSFNAHVYSLPRARKYIEEAFKLLPQGELGIRYSLDQKATDSCSWCSGLMLPCEYDAFRDAVNRMYKHEDEMNSYTYEDLCHRCNLKDDCSVDSVNNILVGIRDDIRYCSAQQLQEGLEKFFQYLMNNDIYVEDGYLEWEDEYDDEHLYAWRCSRLSHSISHQFLVLDKKTNAVIHSKTWAAKRDEKGKVIYTDSGDCIYEIIEKDGPYFEKD